MGGGVRRVPKQVSFHRGQPRLHSERQSQNKKKKKFTAKEQPGVPEIGAEWKRAQETKLAPHFSVPAATFPTPAPFPMTCTIHSPTISAPMNRLRRTLTNQNQRCGKRQPLRSRLGAAQPVLKTCLDPTPSQPCLHFWWFPLSSFQVHLAWHSLGTFLPPAVWRLFSTSSSVAAW